MPRFDLDPDNTQHGFYGAWKREDQSHVNIAWLIAGQALVDVKGMNVIRAKNVLESISGRWLAEDLVTPLGMPLGAEAIQDEIIVRLKSEKFCKAANISS